MAKDRQSKETFTSLVGLLCLTNAVGFILGILKYTSQEQNIFLLYNNSFIYQACSVKMNSASIQPS